VYGIHWRQRRSVVCKAITRLQDDKNTALPRKIAFASPMDGSVASYVTGARGE